MQVSKAASTTFGQIIKGRLIYIWIQVNSLLEVPYINFKIANQN